jgi:hypothetical protein
MRLRELVRVTKPGGRVKVMAYHLDSLSAWYKWVKYGVRRFRGRRRVLCHHLESAGTKAFTYDDVRRMCGDLPVHVENMRAPLTFYDWKKDRGPLAQVIARLICERVDPDKRGFFLHLTLRRDATTTLPHEPFGEPDSVGR